MPELEKESLSQQELGDKKFNVGGLNVNNQQDGLRQYIGHDEIVVHTMPKRFFGTKKTSGKKAKTTGMIILFIGVAFIVFALIFAYLYFLSVDNTSESIIVEPIESDIKNAGLLTTEAIPEPSLEPEPAIIEPEVVEPEPENIIENIDISSTTASIASSSDVVNLATTTKISTGQAFTIAIDSDQDGLSDFEEEVLGTNSQKNDSDDDTFGDKSELLKLYNPTGAGQLIVNANIKKYTNLLYNYSLYHPANWSKEIMGGEESIMFNLGNDEFIQVIIDSNTTQDELKNWYKNQTGIAAVSSQDFYKKGWFTIKSLDNLVYYLKHPEKNEIIIISYNLGLKNILSYQNIFQMMVNSLELSY